MLGEDIAALAGLVIAFVFVALAGYTGDTRYDAAGSIAIGVVLIVVAVLHRGAHQALLIGRSAEPELERSIDECIAARRRRSKSCFNTITMQFGPQICWRQGPHASPGSRSTRRWSASTSSKWKSSSHHPEVGWCFVEPDVTD